MKSKCCSAPLTVEGDVTKFYKCQACGNPADPKPCSTPHDFNSMMKGKTCPECGFGKQEAYEQAAKLATEEQERVMTAPTQPQSQPTCCCPKQYEGEPKLVYNHCPVHGDCHCEEERIDQPQQEQEKVISKSVYRAKCHNCNRSLGLYHDTDKCLFHAIIRISQLESRMKCHTITLALVGVGLIINALANIL